MRPLYNGDIVHVSGDSADLWIKDYNVRVDTDGRVEEDASPRARKVLVTLFNIDGDANVTTYVKRSAVSLVSPDYARFFPGGVGQYAMKGAMKICQTSCRAPCKCGRTREYPPYPALGAGMTCPLERYNVPDDIAKTPWYTKDETTKKELTALCARCEHATVTVSVNELSVSPKDFNKYCMDCPVLSERESLEETEAEARCS